ncbi:MAG: aldehyde dehydrogenase family protein [Pseudomonadota bacterium]|nr:aldehyde dehydrogenase family protein [Pseudomonadota bacterium]
MTNSIEIRNPWTGKIDYQIDEPSKDWLISECSRLRSTQREWVQFNVIQRTEALKAFAEALHANHKEIISALKADTGRARIAQIEFDLMIQGIERVCLAAPRVVKDEAGYSSNINDITAHQQKVPYGLVLNIAPWNFPLLLSLIDVFPALAVGNACIVKPSEVTPRWVEPVKAALEKVPTLKNVLSFAIGSGKTGAELINHVDAVSFTGSVVTGREVAKAAANKFIPVFLELGGNDPAIVLKSADIDKTAEKIVWSSTTSSGQACQSLERVYVDKGIAEKFTTAVIKHAKNITINYPKLEDGFIGPFIFKQQPRKVADQLEDAVNKGAKILTGGKLIDHGGVWLNATVLIDVNHEMDVMREETFGPVIPIMEFSTENEAVELANDTYYGLSASVFAGTLEEGAKLARRIDAGAISINDASLTSRVHTVPHESFGLSGMGRSRFGDEALLRYMRTKAIIKQHN